MGRGRNVNRAHRREVLGPRLRERHMHDGRGKERMRGGFVDDDRMRGRVRDL